MAGLKLLAFVARYVLVYAGSVTLLDRAEGGIEVGSIHFGPSLSVSSLCSFEIEKKTSRLLNIFRFHYREGFTPRLFFDLRHAPVRLTCLRISTASLFLFRVDQSNTPFINSLWLFSPLRLVLFQDMSLTDPGEPMQFTTALYVSAMMLSTVGGPVPVSAGARVAAAIAVLVFLPLAAIRVRGPVVAGCSSEYCSGVASHGKSLPSCIILAAISHVADRSTYAAYRQHQIKTNVFGQSVSEAFFFVHLAICCFFRANLPPDGKPTRLPTW